MRNPDEFQAAIIDYGMGNLFSVQRACEHAGINAVITADKELISGASAAILPGVGAFGNAMENLSKLDLIGPIKDFAASGKPFMGICLGMQLLFEESEEFGAYQGLGIFRGEVARFPGKEKIPEIGWNRVFFPGRASAGLAGGIFFSGINPGAYMYFVHSYYCCPADKELIVSETEYDGVKYCSSIAKDNVFAVQFHPEKSACDGLKLYENWAKQIKTNGVLNEN